MDPGSGGGAGLQSLGISGKLTVAGAKGLLLLSLCFKGAAIAPRMLILGTQRGLASLRPHGDMPPFRT
jgi:hypothetical protein